MPRKKVKSISTFDLTTLFTTIPHNFLIKVLPEVINFSFKSKIRSHMVFQKHRSTGHQKVLEVETSQNKL